MGKGWPPQLARRHGRSMADTMRMHGRPSSSSEFLLLLIHSWSLGEIATMTKHVLERPRRVACSCFAWVAVGQNEDPISDMVTVILLIYPHNTMDWFANRITLLYPIISYGFRQSENHDLLDTPLDLGSIPCISHLNVTSEFRMFVNVTLKYDITRNIECMVTIC